MRDATERIRPETHRVSVGIDRGVEIAGVLQIESQVDMHFGNVRPRLDALAIGLDRAGRIAQVFEDQSEREPGAAVALVEALRLVQARCAPIAVRPSVSSTFPAPARASTRSGAASSARRKATMASAWPVDRLQRRAQSRVVHRIRRRFRPRAQGRARLFPRDLLCAKPPRSRATHRRSLENGAQVFKSRAAPSHRPTR